jgi:hypothetical protein
MANVLVPGHMERSVVRSALYVFLYNVPDWVGNGYENLVNRIASFEPILAIDASLPLGQRSYVSAMTGREVNTEVQKSLFEKAKDFVGSVKDTALNVAHQAGETVQNLFYGAIVLGGVGIVYKLVS